MNSDVREAAKKSGVYLYSVAAELGISEPTLTRWLRFELPKEKKKRILFAISQLSAKKSQ